MFLKKFIPKSLLNRFLLIILIPSVIVQITIIYIFYYNYINNINKHMAESMSSQVYLIYQIYQKDMDAELIPSFSKKSEITSEIIRHKKIHPKYYNYKAKNFLGFINVSPIIDSFTYLRDSLKRGEIELFIIYPSQDKNRVTIEVQMGDDVLKLNVPKKKIITSRRGVFIAWIIVISTITSLISILFIKNQIKSIRSLKRNAQKLGMGVDVVNFKIKGASEIRSLGISLIQMKGRISRQINQRTLMLSGVSHDLRTLLTRMKLQIALMDKNDQLSNLGSDILDMESMINEYLEFNKGNQSENSSEINAKLYFDEIVSSYQSLHKNIDYRGRIGEKIKISCKANNLKRALRNVIDNAVKYTKDHVYISAKRSRNNIIIEVGDNGLGVEDGDLDKIFRPFYRLDYSRNLDIIGTGLGLSIAKDIITSHGGQISAGRSSYGGLCIKIILPL